VTKNFDQQFVWEMLHKEYARNLQEAKRNVKFYRGIAKPVLDFTIAGVVLMASLPVMLVCMVLLAKENRGKIWFTQVRPGRKGKLFKVIKFRTMNDERDEHGNLLPDEKRLHGIGKLIRKSSLDELPQLLNVVKGDMSIVGPRPLLEEYLPLYNEAQRRRHEVKPGITGWAQVNGRNAISWEKKFEYDVWYVENQSFMLDIKILLLTVLKVFKAEGISSATSVTMEKFTGTPNPGR
jgi:lipopolysaccharide/colanic/teichoic acid biosynthesis glycosyltransferase